MTSVVEARNPRTGQVDWRRPATTVRSLHEAVARARAAQVAWRALGAKGRSEVLGALSDAIGRRREALVSALVADTGRQRESAMEVDGVLGLIATWRSLAERALATPPEK